MPTLDQVGELAFIDAIERLARGRTRGVKVGIGDDAAVVATSKVTVLTTDSQRENVHFRRAWLSPAEIGRRAFRVAVSDVAAMAATPRYVLLSFGAPPTLELDWARRMIAALVADARQSGAALVGGNVSKDDAISIVVTIIAEAGAKTPLRSSGKPGDTLWVTGSLGGAAAGVELLERATGAGLRASRARAGVGARPADVERGARRSDVEARTHTYGHPLIAAYRTPPLRLEVARALAKSAAVGAMIDVSDGLLQDLGRLCRASGVSACLDLDRIPLARGLSGAAARQAKGRREPRRSLERPALDYALHGGDDYELLFTTRRASVEKIGALCERHGCMVSPIGVLTHPANKPHVTDMDGRRLSLGGYTHF